MDVPQAVLEWDRGALEAECERAATVQAGVEAYLGRSVFSSDGELVVQVRLSRVAEAGVPRVVANVTQHDASGKVWGERRVTGDASCASLDEPLTLVVALMVDAPAPAAEEPPAEPPAEPKPPASERATEPPSQSGSGEIETAPSLAHAESAPGHAAFLAFGVATMGALPATAAGGRALVSVKPRSFVGLGADILLLAPQRKALGSGSLDVSLLALSGSICPLQGVDGATWYSACASFGAARLRAKSHDLFDSRRKTQWFALPSLSARAAWIAAGSWLLGGGLDVAFPLSADRYVYRDPQGMTLPAHELASLVVTASLGVGLLVK
ncbi:MAG TPA: hypothetical protein VHP33_34500 [Polyangiaceae bacterium]|nr:hypothetical protein [Polyangiaceae bacterium]